MKGPLTALDTLFEEFSSMIRALCLKEKWLSIFSGSLCRTCINATYCEKQHFLSRSKLVFFFFFHLTLLDKKEDKISENNSIFNFWRTAFSGKMAKYWITGQKQGLSCMRRLPRQAQEMWPPDLLPHRRLNQKVRIHHAVISLFPH